MKNLISFSALLAIIGVSLKSLAADADATALDDSAKTEHFFPLIADGDGFRSRLFVTNVSHAANQCALSLQGPGLDAGIFQANGAVTPAETRAMIDLDEAGASVTLASTGTGALTFGYMKLDCDEPAVARVLLSLESGGTLLSLATMKSASPGTSFQIPVLPRLGRLAMVFSNAADLDAACAAELEDEAGRSVGGGSVAVPAESTALRFLDELIAGSGGIETGKVRLSCDRDVAAVGLPLNGAVFTALSATNFGWGNAGGFSLVLPLIQDGDGFRSQLLFTNLADSVNSCTMDLRGGQLDASRFRIPADSSIVDSSINFDIAAGGGQALLSSTGQMALAWGYGEVSCWEPVAARNVLTVEIAGNLAGMAEIASAQPASGMEITLAPGLGQLSLVLSNDYESATSCAVELSADGVVVSGRVPIPVAGRSTAVRFLGDLLSLPDGFAGGVVRLGCDSNVSATSLLIDETVFSAVPPVISSVRAILADFENGKQLEASDPARAQRIRALPWIADGIDGSERNAVWLFIEAAYRYSGLFDALMRRSWALDEISRDEESVVSSLVEMSDNWWGRGEPDMPSMRAMAIRILEMPFLDSVWGADSIAMRTLGTVNYSTGSSAFLEFMDHPALSDGITDAEARILAVLDYGSHHSNPELNEMLLDLGSAAIELKVIGTPISAGIELAVIRNKPGSGPVMELLEHSVRVVEEFMGEPLPLSYVGLLLVDTPAQPYEFALGTNFGTHITIELSPLYNVDYDGAAEGEFARILAHEVAHYFWSGATGNGWVSEGAATFMESIYESARAGAPVVERPSRHIDCNIFSIAENDRQKDYSLHVNACDYYLGEQLFMDLYQTLGRETFRRGFRDFYLKARRGVAPDDCAETLPDICRLEAAFKAGASDEVAAKVDEVVARWYHGIGAAASLAGLEGRADISPQQAHRIKAFLPWVADGVDDSEREAAELIIVAANKKGLFFSLVRKSWVRDGITSDEAALIEQLLAGCVPVESNGVADDDLDDLGLPSCLWVQFGNGEQLEATDPARAQRIKALPWIADGIDDPEINAAEIFVEAAYSSPEFFDALMRRSWALDEISRDEELVVEYLGRIVGSWWGGDEPDTQSMRAMAIKILEMPFLDSVSFADASAVRFLADAKYSGTSAAFLELMDHPALIDGITDAEARLIAVLDQSYPDLSKMLLDLGPAAVEHKIIGTRSSGDIELAVIRTKPGSGPVMELLEHSVRAVEEFMGEPLPVSYVGLLLVDAPGQQDSYAYAHNYGTHIRITAPPRYNVDYDGANQEWFAETLAAEVAHYYWDRVSGNGWVVTGAVRLMELISENARVGTPVERPFGYTDCNVFSIAENDRQKDYSLRANACDNYLGEQLFLDLYHTLGRETFRRGFRDFYLKALRGAALGDCAETLPDICRVEAAFKAGASGEVAAKVDEVVARWYHGIGAAASLAGLEGGADLSPALAHRIQAFLPWVADGVDDSEREAAELIVSAASSGGSLFVALVRKSWVRDGITSDEAALIEQLLAGCVPVEPNGVADYDLNDLGLPSCTD